MTIVNMVGGGGDPEEISLTLPVLNATDSYHISVSNTTTYTNIYATTNTIKTGTVIAYPEQRATKVSVKPSVDATSEVYSDLDTYTRRVKVNFTESDRAYLDAIYNAFGTGFYMACSVYARNKNGRNIYAGDPIVVNYYTRGLETAYVNVTYSGPSVNNYYLIPVGVYS